MLEIPIPGRSMELRHVWYFSATREAGSVVAAAAKLRVAQPALSRQIKDLEDELGVQLFSRERTGVRPTPAGLIFNEGVQRLTHRLEQALVGVTATVIPAVSRAARAAVGALLTMATSG
jgi:DNA-binding transcriptional LysR family regulator